MAPRRMRRGRRRHRRRRNDRPLLAVLVLVAAVLFGLSLSERNGGTTGPADTAGSATVVRVVDGDTLVAQVAGSEERIRLIGIDTPESVDPDQPPECYGHEASDRLAQLLPAGTPIRLERDVEPRDRYDRLLAYVFRAEDNLFVNRDQVARGFAEAKEYPPNTTRADDLEAAEASARTARAGMWGAC